MLFILSFIHGTAMATIGRSKYYAQANADQLFGKLNKSALHKSIATPISIAINPALQR